MKLCDDIRDINFKDFRMFLHFKRKFVVVEIGDVQLRFTHHKENSKFDKPTRGKTPNTSMDIMCKDIINTYFRDVFNRRVARMDLNSRFVFVLDSAATYREHPPVTDCQIREFINKKINPCDKKILITTNPKYAKFKSENLEVIVTNTGNTAANGRLVCQNNTFRSWVGLR